jgi:hypothetical protein
VEAAVFVEELKMEWDCGFAINWTKKGSHSCKLRSTIIGLEHSCRGEICSIPLEVLF